MLLRTLSFLGRILFVYWNYSNSNIIHLQWVNAPDLLLDSIWLSADNPFLYFDVIGLHVDGHQDVFWSQLVT